MSGCLNKYRSINQYCDKTIYLCAYVLLLVRVMVLNATFNNISVISWRSVLLVEEIGVSGKNHRPAASH